MSKTYYKPKFPLHQNIRQFDRECLFGYRKRAIWDRIVLESWKVDKSHWSKLSSILVLICRQMISLIWSFIKKWNAYHEFPVFKIEKIAQLFVSFPLMHTSTIFVSFLFSVIMYNYDIIQYVSSFLIKRLLFIFQVIVFLLMCDIVLGKKILFCCLPWLHSVSRQRTQTKSFDFRLPGENIVRQNRFWRAIAINLP